MRIIFPLLSLISFVYARELSSAHTQLIALADTHNGVIKLNDATFDLITAPDREWSAVIQFTALSPNVKCAPCKLFEPIFHAVAKAWKNAPITDRQDHFFATLDFQDGADVFRRLGLTSAPIVNIYPAAKGPRRPANGKWNPFQHEFGSEGFDAAAFASSMSKYTPSPIPYQPPPNYDAMINIGAGVAVIVLVLRFAGPILASRWTWACLTIILALTFNAGYMFVQIRGAPMVGRASKGGPVQWMAGGFQNQYGMEYQVIGGIYGILAFAHAALFLLVPRVPSAVRQRTGVYLWTTVIFILFSVLISFFRVKNPGYPFRLFF